MENPVELIEHTITHRLRREKKVLDSLQKLSEASLSTLVVSVYDDVDKGLHRIAESSLWAHLIKLEEDGVVASRDQRGQLVWRVL